MKRILLLLSVFTSFIACGQQFQPAKLVYANGKTSTGLVKVPQSGGDKYVVVKAGESVPKEKISSEEISKIVFTPKDEEPVEYAREFTMMNGKQSKNRMWLQVMVKGPATLYALSSTMVTSRGGNFGHQVSDFFFYAKRSGEEAASFVGHHFVQGAIGLNTAQLFKKHAGTYFADYAALAAKIENRAYKVTDVVAVVDDYNRWKKGKKK